MRSETNLRHHIFAVIRRSLILVCVLVVEIGSAACQTDSSPDELRSAKAYLKQARYADCEKLLQAYLSIHPADPDAVYLLGYVLFRENKPADSLRQYTAAAQLRTPAANDLKTVALDYVLLNDYADAERWSRKAISLDANDPESWYELGRIEYNLNHFQQAVDSFHRSLALDPTSVKAENNLGLALEGLDRNDDAIAAYSRALALQANSPQPSEQPMLNLATLLIDRNDLKGARPLLEHAAQIAPQDTKILAQLGRLYSESGDLPAAQRALEKAVALDPQVASLHFQLGQIYRKAGAPDKAAHEFATVQQLLGTKSTPQK